MFGADSGPAAILRREMVECQVAARGVTEPSVLEAMSEVPRHLFIEGADLRTAYGDHPVPIRSGQTVSQPFVVALMLSMASPLGGRKVLEIGTGSGYQTALLARMGARVVSLDVLPGLCIEALARLRMLGLSDSVAVIAADGYSGWVPAAPYDAIIVSAAPPAMPAGLPGQLSQGGRLVIPVGGAFQQLVLVERTPEGFAERAGDPVRFVPLVHPGGR